MSRRDVENRVVPELPQEVSLKDLGWRMRLKKLIRKHPIHASDVGAANISPRARHQTGLGWEPCHDRFDQAFTQHSRDTVIDLKGFVDRVPLVPSEQFIAAIACQQCFDSVL